VAVDDICVVSRLANQGRCQQLSIVAIRRRGETIPGTDVTHIFGLSPEVGNQGKKIVNFQ
jgi:hypothetical protein